MAIHSSPIHFIPPSTIGTIGQILTCSDSIGNTQWDTVASQNFTFTKVQFVAIGGDDLNDGLTLDTPKATIQAAIDAGSDGFLIWVLDGGQYAENLTFSYSGQLWAPNAELDGIGSGDLITVTNSSLVRLHVGSINQGGPGLAINIATSSTIFLDATLIQGDITCAGNLILNDVATIISNVHILSGAQFSVMTVDAIGCTFTFDLGSTVFGNIGAIIGPGNTLNTIYGNQQINGNLNINGSYTFPAADGTSGQAITTDGAGNLSFSTVSGGSGISWSGVAGTTQAAAVNSGYVIQNGAQTTVTLPATAPLGSIVAIAGLGASGWVLQANGGQVINAGTVATSAGGTLTSANQFDCIEVVCIVADTTWAMRSAITTGFTPT